MERATPALPLEARRDEFVACVARGLADSGVSADDIVLAALSGGADSTALAGALSVITARRDGPRCVGAVHVHHHQRGREADADATHCLQLGEMLGLPIEVCHLDPETTRTGGRARDARYAALADAAERTGATVVVTAHHADDQFETMLMALARGTGARQLGAMRAVRPLNDDIRLVRPLLETRRAEARRFCTVAGLAWREDATNADPDTIRGRLRRDVMPVLEMLYPGAAGRAAATAADLHSLLPRVAEELSPPTRWIRDELAALPPTHIGAALRTAALHCVPGIADALNRRTIDAAARAVRDDEVRPRRFDWPGGIVVHVTAREITIESPTST